MCEVRLYEVALTLLTAGSAYSFSPQHAALTITLPKVVLVVRKAGQTALLCAMTFVRTCNIYRYLSCHHQACTCAGSTRLSFAGWVSSWVTMGKHLSQQSLIQRPHNLSLHFRETRCVGESILLAECIDLKHTFDPTLH